MNRHFMVGIGLCLTARLASAQAPAVTTLQIDVANQRAYTQDISDPLRFAADANAAPSLGLRTFASLVNLADIVAVNGKPAKGVFVARATRLGLTPSATPGAAIADVERSQESQWHFEILQDDGTPIGSLMASGLAGGIRPPGGPLNSAMHNMAIVGGTGAFFGARGQAGQAAQPFTRPPAGANVLSMAADPANRRTQGGGTLGFIVQFVPLVPPGIVITANGPAVFHADSSAVSDDNPARGGEVLTLQATGLGPTRPGVDPGKPFPADPLQNVNSPVDVTIGGKSAAVVKAMGWPGLADTYQVDFRMPEVAAPGIVAVQLTSAWMQSSEAKIPAQ